MNKIILYLLKIRRNVKNDPGCIMTTVFRRASPNHRIRTADNEIALLLDYKQKIVFLENNHKNKKADIPMVSNKFDKV